MDKTKLLIISNNCLSTHNANGRTLLNLVSGIEKSNIFQIYTSGELSSFDYCADFLRLTDKDIIKSWFFKKPQNNQSSPEEKTVDVNMGSKKNAVTMLLRDLVWDNSITLKRYVLAWAQKKAPDAVLLQLGDNTLLIQLALSICKKLNLPLVTYNTENYYFKDYDFIKKEFKAGLFYRLYHYRFCRKFHKMMALEPTCLYNCEGLRELYDGVFGTQSTVIMPVTELIAEEHSRQEGVVYAGNLGVGRHKTLIEIAETLQQIDSGLVLDVYGRANEQVEAAFREARGLNHHGFVSYEDNLELIKNARLLIHVESFDPFFAEDTKFAFSTKLADYCATGNPMLVYAPEQSESYRYLAEEQAAFTCTKLQELEQVLKAALFDEQRRKDIVGRAVELSKKNNNVEQNSLEFIAALKEAVKRG